MAKKTALSDLLAKAKATAPRASNVWHPKAGDSITGVIVAMKTNRGRLNNETKERGSYLSLRIATETGEEIVVNCGYLLDEEIRDQGAVKGDSIAIIYDGEEKTSGGNKIHTYRVAIEKGS